MASFLASSFQNSMPDEASLPNPRTSGRNKDRLYIAYYHTSGVQNAGHAETDTALLLLPKKPKHTAALQSWRFGVARLSRNHQELWEYGGKRCQIRPPHLRALLFLGKVAGDFTGEAADTLLTDVFVAQGDEMWGCTHWTRDAIQTLVEQEVIAPLEGGAGAREIWETGYQFSRRVNQDPKKPVPTCNQRGKAISSEIR